MGKQRCLQYANVAGEGVKCGSPIVGEYLPHASSQPLPSCAFQTGLPCQAASHSQRMSTGKDIPCRLSKVVFPKSVLPQIEFLKLTFGTTGMLKKKKTNENILMHVWNLELLQWSVETQGMQGVG